MNWKTRCAIFGAILLFTVFMGGGNSQQIGLVIRAIGVFAGLIALIAMALPSMIPFFGRQAEKIASIDRQRQTIMAVKIVGVLIATHLVGLIIVHLQNRPDPPTKLAPGITYSSEMFNKCEVHTLIIDLEQTRPMILKAQDMADGKRTLSQMFQAAGATAAVNGDFYNAKSVQGFLLSHGRRFTAPRKDRPALGFSNNGTRADIDTYQFASDARVEITNPNKPGNKPDKFRLRWSYNSDDYVPGDVGVYTASHGQADGAGCAKEVLQARVSLENCQEGDNDLHGVITEVVENPETNLKPEGNEIILVAANENTVLSDLSVYGWAKRNFSNSKMVLTHLHVTPKPPESIISGAPQFLQYGEYIVQEGGNPHLSGRQTARTAVGISNDGRYLTVVVAEGSTKWFAVRPKETVLRLVRGDIGGFSRSIWDNLTRFTRSCIENGLLSKILGLTRMSRGMTLQDMARYMRTKGDVSSAINLDGGNCAEMIVANSNGYKRVNQTMEGSEERIATGLAFKPR